MSAAETNRTELIKAYLEEILKKNGDINLTSITDPDKAWMLHVEDSLSALPEMQAAPQGLYADMGSGSGFPGVPLAIVTGRQAVLIDSVKKKMGAVSEILHGLSLDDQIRTYSGRGEELANERPGEFSVVSARALSSLPSLVELASPLLAEGGELICFKGQLDEAELEQSQAISELTGLELKSRRSFTLSDGETKREIVVFRK
ncbi:MAG: 16S rRNA (guanine(527)-N(7))-methyltransferase RsmG, partial [Eggerthellaceae bacterium]|nr:16S rRNA (guanine(527)-N(7))-methyltransferase RsmG [Eggerthellaceae bacterium]